MKRTSFVFYEDMEQAIETLPEELQPACYKALVRYGLYGEEPEKGTIVYTLFIAFRSRMDLNNKKYIKGNKGGRPRKDGFEEENHSEDMVFNEETIDEVRFSDNDNEYDNDNDNKKENIKEKRNEDISSVVSYLNDRASTHYRSSSRNTRSHINARLEDGFTLEDFKQVIDTKCDEWLGTDMAKYLRPDTLFGTKFESYLNQKPRAKPQAPNYSIDNSNLGITEEDIERYLK